VGDAVGVRVGVLVAVEVELGVAVAVAVGEEVGMLVGELLGVSVAVRVGVLGLCPRRRRLSVGRRLVCPRRVVVGDVVAVALECCRRPMWSWAR